MIPFVRRSEELFSRAGDRARQRREFAPPSIETSARVRSAPIVLRPVALVLPIRRARCSWAVALLACLALAALSTGAASADPTTTSIDPTKAQSELDRDRQRSEDLKAQLDVLNVSDDQLNAELLQLDDRVKQQEAEGVEADAGRADAEAQLTVLDGQLVDARKAAEQARGVAADRAVAAYLRPERETAAQLLAAKNPQQLGEMRVLVNNVAQYDHSVMLNKATTEYLLTAKQNELQLVREQAAGFARQAASDLADVTTLKARRVDVRDEVTRRISEVKGEAEALNRQEAALSALISARASIQTTTTTAVPTTTTAPTTTSAGPPPPGVTTTVKATTTSTAAPPTTKPPTGPGKTLSWPVSGPVTSGFGPRWGTFHKGIDIGVGQGVPIHAAADGTVFFSGVMDGYGNVILIDHGNGVVTLYGHQSQLIAGSGQRVARGEVIGLVGSTGHSTGPHLHFEVRVNGVAYDPLAYLP